MKIIIHLYLNVNCTEISSSEIQIESNEITVKELKKTLSEIYLIKASEQILTIKLLGLKVITLSDEYPLSFFYIKNNSEIYLDSIHKYENKTPTEISKMNSLQNFIIPNIFNRYKTKQIKKIYISDKLRKDIIVEKIEEISEDENGSYIMNSRDLKAIEHIEELVLSWKFNFLKFKIFSSTNFL